jgi:phospholipase A-2-activating protein
MPLNRGTFLPYLANLLIQVRAVVFPGPKDIISASRDGTVRTWTPLSGPPPVFENNISSHGNGFINTVAYLPPSTEYPSGLIISGGQETIIDVRAPGKAPDDNAEALLLGHTVRASLAPHSWELD